MIFSRDTSLEAERIQVEIFRRMPAEQKLRQVWDLNAMVRGLATEGLRMRLPDAAPRELEEEYLRLILPPRIAGEVIRIRRARAGRTPGE